MAAKSSVAKIRRFVLWPPSSDSPELAEVLCARAAFPPGRTLDPGSPGIAGSIKSLDRYPSSEINLSAIAFSASRCAAFE